MERDDAELLDETFSHGPKRQSDRFEAAAPARLPSGTAEALTAREAPIVFIEDMAYQARPIEDRRCFAKFTNTFLRSNVEWNEAMRPKSVVCRSGVIGTCSQMGRTVTPGLPEVLRPGQGGQRRLRSLAMRS